MTDASSNTTTNNKKRGTRCQKIAITGFGIALLLLQILDYKKSFQPTQVHLKNQRGIRMDTVQSSISIISQRTSYQSTQLDDEPTRCWRHCPKRINKIYFEHSWAGLGDRSVVLHMLGNLAGYLCAIVELPPPSILLNPIHNGGKKLHKRVEWKDFFNFTFLQDGSQVVYEAKDNPKFTQKVNKNWRQPGLYKPKRYPGWQFVVTKSKAGSIINDYRRAQDISWRQGNNTNKGFIWEIHRVIYGSRLLKKAPLPEPSNEVRTKLQEHAYNGSMRPFMKSWKGNQKEEAQSCNYVIRNEPDDLLMLQKELQNRVRSMAPSNTSVFGFLHVRRNDAKKACNTDIPNLSKFFQCSLNGTEATGRHITFLLGSDEKSETYRHDVIDMTNDYSHVSMLDADKLVTDFMQDMIRNNKMPSWRMNNFYQFELMKALGLDGRSFSSVYLVQRRNSHCPRCSKLLTEFPTAWA
ncbi:unnamed protein product [Cylindrotheca closterium]|uniref:Uncharacterized protein n=1 Tax=Cylindrotheca closterium TaxID=2856 RepID=A0AAD2JPK8_9STRA|nr:unnamed protein product [Cylindrotheca closterium]